jgi:hypothetical protein
LYDVDYSCICPQKSSLSTLGPTTTTANDFS